MTCSKILLFLTWVGWRLILFAFNHISQAPVQVDVLFLEEILLINHTLSYMTICDTLSYSLSNF